MWLFLIHFKGLAIRVIKEDIALACRPVSPDVLVGDSHAVQFSDLGFYVIDLKCQMTQTCRLGIG